MASAYEKDREVKDRLQARGVCVTLDQANTLRRASIALHRWAEGECGDGNDHYSWSIERDESTGKPYRVVYPHTGESRRHPIPDRERGALRRVAALCRELGAHFYHQTDPRGCVLYVASEPLTDQTYSTRGVAIY